MRKIMKIASILTFLLAALAIFVPAALNASQINVTVDGTAVDFAGQPPAIINGRTLVPVRGVFEALDFDVDWDQATQTVTLSRGAGLWVEIAIGTDIFIMNDIEFRLDVPAQIVEGRTMLPIRAVVESLGYRVGWNQATNTVAIVTYVTIGDLRYRTSGNRMFLMDSGLTDADIAPLIYMTRLEVLYLQNNQITDLTPLVGLANLELLNISSNQISDLTPLAGLANLNWLFAEDNPIADWSPVEHIELVEGRP